MEHPWSYAILVAIDLLMRQFFVTVGHFTDRLFLARTSQCSLSWRRRWRRAISSSISSVIGNASFAPTVSAQSFHKFAGSPVTSYTIIVVIYHSDNIIVMTMSEYIIIILCRFQYKKGELKHYWKVVELWHNYMGFLFIKRMTKTE